MAADLCIVVACNSDAILQNNLLRSEMVSTGIVPVSVIRNAASAAIAYNSGLDNTTAPFVIFAHQDVYFPPGWESRLSKAIAEVERLDPNWALIAPFGMSEDGSEHRGDVWTTSLGAQVGRSAQRPVRAQGFDELAMVLRRASGLRFDEQLPCFHFYGTDIVQTARTTGHGAYVVDLPLVHNDGFHGRLGSDFTTAYHYMRRKWRRNLPLRTSVLWIDRFGCALYAYQLRAAWSYEKRKALAGDVRTDPRIFSASCGWE